MEEATNAPRLRDLLGWTGPVRAAFIGRDWSLSPVGWQEKPAWEANRRSLLAMLPDGARLCADGGSVTIGRDASGIPTLYTDTGDAWLRLGSSVTVETFFLDFDQAIVIIAAATVQN